MESVPSLIRGDETAGKRRPLFLRRRPNPTKMRRQDSVAVAREMYCYLQWARDVTTMTFDAIIAEVMDLALSDYLRQDKAWRSLRARILSKHETSDWRQILSDGSTRTAVRGPQRQ
jgi:hypothetical protein